MSNSFEQDSDWAQDLNEVKMFLKGGDTFRYVDKMIELRDKKGNDYASAIEAAALKKSKESAKKETGIVTRPKDVGNNSLDIQRKIKNVSIKVENNSKSLKQIYQQIRQEALKLVHEQIFEPEKFNESNLNRYLAEYEALNKEYLETAPNLILPDVQIYIPTKQPTETLFDYYARLRVSKDKRNIPVVPRTADERTFEYYERLIRQKAAWNLVAPEIKEKPRIESISEKPPPHDADWKAVYEVLQTQYSSIEELKFIKGLIDSYHTIFGSTAFSYDDIRDLQTENSDKLSEETEKLNSLIIRITAKKGTDYLAQVNDRAFEDVKKLLSITALDLEDFEERTNKYFSELLKIFYQENKLRSRFGEIYLLQYSPSESLDRKKYDEKVIQQRKEGMDILKSKCDLIRQIIDELGWTGLTYAKGIIYCASREAFSPGSIAKEKQNKEKQTESTKEYLKNQELYYKQQQKENNIKKEQELAKGYSDIFSYLIEQDLDWSSIEGDFFVKYMMRFDAQDDESSVNEINNEIQKLRAEITSKKGMEYVHAVEMKASEHATEMYHKMRKWDIEEKTRTEETRREESVIAEKTRQDNLKKERDDFCQQLGNTIATPIINAMLSMNAANQAQFDRTYLQFDNTYRQLTLEVVSAINEQNGQYFEKLGRTLEDTLRESTSANLEGLERAALMICRTVNGPIKPRQPNEGPIEWLVRVYAQQDTIVPIPPKEENEGFLPYLARTIVQRNSITPILPRSSRETIFDYLARLKISQNYEPRR